MPGLDLNKSDRSKATKDVNAIVPERNADYALVNNLAAIVITGLLTFAAAAASIYGGWIATEATMVVIFFSVFLVIVFLLIAIF